jgi:hypothetical protein
LNEPTDNALPNSKLNELTTEVTIEEADPPANLAQETAADADGPTPVKKRGRTSKKTKVSTASSSLKTSVNQSDLVGALNRLSGVTVNNHDVLKFVHLLATSNSLELTAFNLKTQSRISIAATTDVAGSVLINPKIDVLQQLEGNLTLDFMEQGLIHSEQGLLQIPLAKCKEFPALKMPSEHVSYTISSTDLKGVLNCTSFADPDIKSPYSGVKVLVFSPFQDGSNPKVITPIKGLATNCEVIVRYQSHAQIQSEPEQAFMLPIAACQQIKDILPSEGDVTLKVSTTTSTATVIRVSVGQVEITAQTTAINQETDLESILPSEQQLKQWKQLKIESGALKSCITRHLSTFTGADKKTRSAGMPLSFDIDGSHIHTTSSYNGVVWSENLEQENTDANGAFSILMNLQILQKAVSMMGAGAFIIEISPGSQRTVLLSTSSGKVEILTATMQTA